MRTTVTLAPDIARKLRELAHRRRTSFKDTLDHVLRRGLAAQEPSAAHAAPFQVEPHRGGFKPGIDPDKLNQLLDQLEAEEFASTSRRGA